MTNQELIHHIIRLYQQANKLTDGFENDAVMRGRRHTISSKVEDLLAGFIQQRLADPSIRLWVDYALSYTPPGAARAKTIYPDIAIVRRVGDTNTVLAMVDVKMDLGWKRDLGERMENIAADVRQLQQANYANRRVPDDMGKKQNEAVRISPSLKLKYAVMSDQNGSEAEFKANREAAARYPNELQLYAFTTGHYLGYASTENITIRHSEINQFITDLLQDVAITSA